MHKVLVIDGDVETLNQVVSMLNTASRQAPSASLEPVVKSLGHTHGRETGFSVRTAEQVDQAMKEAADFSPNVVLLAAHIGSTSGFEVLHDLRRLDATHDASIIVMSDADDEKQLAQAFASGADDVLRKPILPAELIARVRVQTRLHDYTEELGHEKHDAQVMLELTQALASSLDFRDILYTLVRRIADVVKVARVSIVLAPERDDEDVGYVIVASDDARLSNLKLSLAKYPEIQEVLRTHQPLTIEDISKHPVLDGVRNEMPQGGPAAMSLFPIVWQDQAIGVLFLRAQARRSTLSSREVHFCQTVANATAVALRNARVMQSLRDHTQQITFARFEAEQQLRSLQRYADLFASAAEGIAVLDVNGRLLFANPRAYDIVGEQQDNTRGRGLRGLVARADRRRAVDLWRGFSRGEYPRGVDLRFVHASGETIVCSCSFASLLDGEGAVLVSFQDVTEQRKTEAELVKTMQFLESLIDASVDGIVAADMDGNIILFNQGAERIYGYLAEEVVGRMSTRDLYPGEGAAEVMRRLWAPQYGGVGRLEPMRIDALGQNGELIPIQISAAMIHENGEPAATFGIFTDLREKLQFEERLAEAQQRLASTEKQALLAELAGTAAHELNQPLTSVIAYAELLKRKLDPDGAEHRAADIMIREAERMADIVRKIGQMTKYETKSYVGEQKILDLEKSATPSSTRPESSEGA